MRRSIGIFVLLLTLGFAVLGASSSEDVYIYSGGNGAIFTPGHPITLTFEVYSENKTKASAPLSVKLYAATADDALAITKDQAYKGNLRLLRSFQSSDTLKERPQTRVVNLGELPIGYYDVVAWIGANSAAQLIDVSTLGIVVNASGHSASAYAVDLRTMNRHAGPTQFQVAGAGSVVRADADSVARFSPAAGGYIVASTADGSRSIQSIYAYGGQPQTGFVQTDRPIYRPGGLLHLRAILRTGGIGGYAIPKSSPRVQVTGPNGIVLLDKHLPTSAFGTVHADVAIPDDAPLGYYQISIGQYVSGSAQVQAYKKPEYAIAFAATKPYIIGGGRADFKLSAKYFFGRPAAGLHLHYVAYKESSWIRPYSPYPESVDSYPVGRERVKIAEGDFTTGADGRNEVAIGTSPVRYDENITVQADGRDPSGRTVSTTANLRVVPAAFFIGLEPSQWFAQVGDTVRIAVQTSDYDMKVYPKQPLDVEIIGSRWVEKQSKNLDFADTHRAIVTDVHGKASLPFHPTQGGSYRFLVSGLDSRGNKALTSLFFWVAAPSEYVWWAPQSDPSVIASKPSYAPGERARVLITVPSPNRDVLVLVSSDRLVSTRLIHIGGQSASLRIDPPKDAQHFSVVAELPGENGVGQASAQIDIKPADKLLNVRITANKPRYLPGERAVLKIAVTDRYGRAVRSEIGLGIVDEAIYSVLSESQGDPLDAFFGYGTTPYPQYSWNRPNRALKAASTLAANAPAAIAKAGTTSDVYSANGLNPAPRSNFPDTAYWTPSLLTDANGDARISFDWPDSLTTWRATGIAVSAATGVGTGRTTTLVTKDFIVRLELPRFLRKNDRSQIIGIANGQASDPNVSLQVSAGTLSSDPLDRLLHLDGNASASANWNVRPTELGLQTITLRGTDGSRSDAMALPLPIEAAGAAEHQRDAGSLPDRAGATFSLPPGYESGVLRIRLLPSVVAQLVENVRLLDVYPYYCTEQTMSAALPAVFIDRMLHRTGLTISDDLKTGDIVKKSIARLAQLQHSDGSWGWWEHDDAHPFMTAYALYGLAEFRRAGYSVPDAMLTNGSNSLIAQLRNGNADTLRFWGGAQPNSEWNTRAFMLFALAEAAPQRVDRELLAQADAHVRELNSYALAVLGLAHDELGDDATARTFLNALNGRAIEQGGFTHWQGQSWHYAWEDDPIETTAYALRLEVALDPRSPRVGRIVNFLRAEQRGSWWYTTKDTAAAVYAISQTVAADSREFAPDETIRVRLGDRILKTLHIGSPLLSSSEGSISVPAADLHDGSALRFERSGAGALYWSTDWTRYAPPGTTGVSDASASILTRLLAKSSEFEIARRYTAPHSGAWRIGDEIKVDIALRARSDTQYVAIEDPFPAGAEYQPLQGQAGDDWSGLQFFDDRAVFFATQVSANYPLHLRYTLRVTTAGTYTAAPPTAYAMYGPPIRAVGSAQIIEVSP